MNPSAIYHVHYYGLLSERRGLSEEQIRHSATTPAELYQAIRVEYRLDLPTSDCRVAVNDEFVSWNHPLKGGDHIAFLPPMSGG